MEVIPKHSLGGCLELLFQRGIRVRRVEVRLDEPWNLIIGCDIATDRTCMYLGERVVQ